MEEGCERKLMKRKISKKKLINNKWRTYGNNFDHF